MLHILTIKKTDNRKKDSTRTISYVLNISLLWLVSWWIKSRRSKQKRTKKNGRKVLGFFKRVINFKSNSRHHHLHLIFIVLRPPLHTHLYDQDCTATTTTTTTIIFLFCFGIRCRPNASATNFKVYSLLVLLRVLNLWKRSYR